MKVRTTLLVTAAMFVSGAAYAETAPQAANPSGQVNAGPPVTAAQTNDTTPQDGNTDDIVVTGVRASLERAAQIKRNEVVISDAISSEDIGKFPDQNLAESLQRVTGVQITRNKGEGSSISVRGLSPDFTRTTYNGRTIPTPNGGRSFSFTSLSSDFVSAVEVYKSPTADMIEGGLSATVNVRVARPLDQGRDRFAATAEGIYESNPKKVTPHVAIYGNKILADGVLGVNFGVNYERRRVIQAAYTAYGVETRAEGPSAPALDYNRDGQLNGTYRFDHATTFNSDNGSFDRLSFVGGVQAKPIEGFTVYADGFYSRFTDDYNRFEHQLRWTNIAGPNAAIRGSRVGADNLLTFLDADGVDQRGDNRDNRVRDTVASGAVGWTWDLDKLHLSAEGTYSNARRRTDLIAFAMISRASASYDLGDQFDAPPTIAFGRGYNPLDGSTFRLLNINGVNGAFNSNRNKDVRLDARYDLGDGVFRTLRVGGFMSNTRARFQSANYNFSSQFLAARLGLPYSPTIEGGSIPAGSLLQTIDNSRFLSGPLGIYQVPDYNKVFSNVSFADLLAASPVLDQPSQNFIVTEKAKALYARLDFSTPDDVLGGNIGVRYVDTDQTSAGAAPDITQAIVLRGGIQTIVPSAAPTRVKNSYSEWLPSANFRWNIDSNLVARFAVARTLTRPDLGLLSPATSIDANVRTINSGNPRVQPYIAKQVDLSLEYYLGGGGLLSAAAFYKNVDNFIVTTNTLETVTLRREEGGTVTLPFRRFQPNNGASGKIKGLELGAQVPFTFLPGALNGLGMIANVTYLDVNDVPTSQDGPPRALPGVSKWSYNLAGYYEKSGFGLRVSYNFRSRFVNDATSYFGDGDFTKAYGQVDASASYDLNSNLSFNFDVTNLNNAKVTTVDIYDVLRTRNDVGRRVTAGVRVKF